MKEENNDCNNIVGRRLSAHLDKTSIDPSTLTTQQLQRELSVLREVIDARFNGNESVIKLLQLAAERNPEVIDKAVNRLQELHNEKFSSIQTQFRERDVRTEQAQVGSKTAVDTAFVAQKEAVGAALQAAKEAVSEQNKSNTLAISKSEASTTKQIDGIGTLITSTSKATDEKIADIKGRLDRGEGTTKGVKDTKDDNKSWIAVAVSIAAFIVALILGLQNFLIK